jgi:hypothetical protein
MDKKSKIFLAVFFFLIIASIGVTFWRIMLKKDYVIQAQTDCDPTIDKCFIWQCDPESTVEGETCTGDPETDIWYYQIAKRNASKIPLCDPNTDENCDPWTCEEGEKDCSVTFCDETTKVEQGVECNDPVQYNIDNPAEEESAIDCEEGDEECLAAEEEASACEEGDEECLAAEEEEVTTNEGDATDSATTDAETTANDQASQDQTSAEE